METNIAFVTGSDRGLGLALCKVLLMRGWRVFAGQYMPEWPELTHLVAQFPAFLTMIPLDVKSQDSVQKAAQLVANRAERVDLLINNAGVLSPTNENSIRDGLDYSEVQRLYDTNAAGPLRVVEAFLSLTDRSALKRLAFVSSEAGSIARSYRKNTYGYCMSKSALNMAISILFNHLRPEGYTFRVYHPGWVRSYMSGEKNMDAELEPETAAEPAVDYFTGTTKEDRLVMRDWQGQEWPW